jgi:opacity protein-like surface antigen
MALELQQLTTASIDAVQPADSQPCAAIMVEIAGEPSDPQLRDRLQIGLLERGFALTRVPTVGDARVCVASDASGVLVHVVAGTDSCSASGSPTRVAAVGSVEIERELLLDEASASLERFAASASASADPTAIVPEQSAEELPRMDTATDVPAPAAASVPRPSSVTVAAFGGVLGRGGGTDPAFGVELRAGRRRGLGAHLALTVEPSRAEQLRVVEYMPTATFDWRLGFAARGLAMLGVFAGAHVHTYSYSGVSTEHGTRVSASGGASVRMGFLANRGALLFGGVRAGWSGGQWVHLADGDPSWRRSSVMVGVELGVGWDFGLRGRR